MFWILMDGEYGSTFNYKQKITELLDTSGYLISFIYFGFFGHLLKLVYMPNIDTSQYQGEKILLMVLFNAQQWGVFGCCLKWLLLHGVLLPVYLISHISLFSV